MVPATKAHRMRQTSEKYCRNPNPNATAPAAMPMASGQPKLRFKLSVDVFLQASSGPTPVKKRISKPMGIFTRLKYGAPTLMRLPVNYSEKTGNRVPERTATQATTNSKLLNRKLDSREMTESSWFSLFR